MINLSILGSTGSIGKNACWVAKNFPEKFSVKALTASTSIKALADQIAAFKPEMAVVRDKEQAQKLSALVGKNTCRIDYGPDGYAKAASLPGVDTVISSTVGAAGLVPTLAAVDAGKTVALANKEALVMAGGLVMERARLSSVRILPIDSEHSAIFQCLAGHNRDELSRIWLTASGGPFLNTPVEDFASITPEMALAHPNWDMGAKISIDSATMMNKGLEVIEARWLFDVSQKQIAVLVHPQSIVHSMVEYVDGSVIAQMGKPDMRCAIAYAMSFPERLALPVPPLDFYQTAPLNFMKPDTGKFPCLALAFKALEQAQTYPAVLNAANEAAVEAFLNKKIAFLQIPHIVSLALDAHRPGSGSNLADILGADAWARKFAAKAVAK
ncbi:MAG: 1-deoxy-D-xylulose-5-phosphate reductoisomerase [Desulfatibacillaceae bacterium]|nr:1-deoxy-D-xylulose-5-phosphate reductoisomerase [Desulfatibacillaceae bacterium]